MTTQKQLDIAQALLETGLVGKVFHSCQLIRNTDQQNLYPAYPKGTDFIYIGPDDTKGVFAYIRANGDTVAVPNKVASCARNYELTAPLRVVIYHDIETRNHQDLQRRLASFTYLTGVTLVRMIDDKFRLVREESDLYRQHFDAKTFYIAFDITVSILLLQSECEAEEPCEVKANPICL